MTPTNAIVPPGHWIGYTVDMSDADIKLLFSKRYGREPEQIVRLPHLTVAGPVKLEELEAGAVPTDSYKERVERQLLEDNEVTWRDEEYDRIQARGIL